MKTSFLIIALLIASVTTFGQNQAPVAVNDTLYATVGDTIVVTRSFLLQNDFDPDGDSIFIKYVFGFQKVNDTTWRRNTDIYSTDSISIGRYIIRDEHNVNSILSDNIITVVKGYLRSDSLNINNINATIDPIGSHFWDYETAHFEVPKGSGKHSIFTHSMWIGGMRDDTQICTSADRFRQGQDFIVGPLTANQDSNHYIKWNRNWKISKIQIQYHINNWNQPGYEPIEVIKNWPAHGESSLGQSQNIAPYFDMNSNGIYEPLSGDYPLIRGDEAVFFVFNDDVLHTASFSEKLGIEIHGMAYEYNRPNDSTLYNTLFMHYDIINLSTYNYQDTYLGLFTDFDLGFAMDDYIASDVTNGMMYGYNGTAVDGAGQPYAYGDHPPAIGLKVIGGPFLEPDGIDNLSGECGFSLNGLNFGDNIADNERMGMTNFIYYNNQPYYPDTVLIVGNKYYNYMRNIWNDGTHMIYGGNAHPSAGGLGPDCNFMFPGNSDTICNYGTNGILPNGGLNQNGNYWTEATVGNIPDDRRGVASIGPFNFDAGEAIPLDYCFTWARDYNGDNISSAELLRTRIAALAPSWNTLINAPETYFGVTETEQGKLILVYPNPVKNKATITNEDSSQREYLLYSINGIFIKQGILKPGNNLLDISELKAGVYILKSGNSNVRIVKM
jgi:hypothetical protein